MPTILMPALSPTMEEGKLSKWLKNVGDNVKPGDIIAEIETDKATMEVEAVDEGPLSEIRCRNRGREGEHADCGDWRGVSRDLSRRGTLPRGEGNLCQSHNLPSPLERVRRSRGRGPLLSATPKSPKARKWSP